MTEIEHSEETMLPESEEAPPNFHEDLRRQKGADPFHMPTELADGLGVESLPRSYGPD